MVEGKNGQALLSPALSLLIECFAEQSNGGPK